MVEIPNTRRKLREADFFLTRMKDAERNTSLDKEEFDFYLSAFLSAFRSVTLVWQHEDKPSYASTFNAWQDGLTQSEKDFLQFMNDQRVTVIHKEGAPALERQIDHVSILSVTDAASTRNAPPIGWFMSMGFDEYATVGVKHHYFRMQQHQVSVTEICGEALRLLKKLFATA